MDGALHSKHGVGLNNEWSVALSVLGPLGLIGFDLR